MRPAAGEKARVRRERPGCGGARCVEANTPFGQALERRRRGTMISVEAQSIGPHRVQHDQEHVGRIGRRQRAAGFAPLLEPVSTEQGDGQDHDQSEQSGKTPAPGADASRLDAARATEPTTMKSPAPARARPPGRFEGPPRSASAGSPRHRATTGSVGLRAGAKAVSIPPSTIPDTERRAGSPGASTRRSGESSGRAVWSGRWPDTRPSSRPRAIRQPGRTKPREPECPGGPAGSMNPVFGRIVTSTSSGPRESACSLSRYREIRGRAHRDPTIS